MAGHRPRRALELDVAAMLGAHHRNHGGAARIAKDPAPQPAPPGGHINPPIPKLRGYGPLSSFFNAGRPVDQVCTCVIRQG